MKSRTLIAFFLCAAFACAPSAFGGFTKIGTTYYYDEVGTVNAYVIAAVADASTGDTINIPTGSFAWTTEVDVTKALVFEGSDYSDNGTTDDTTDDTHGTVLLDYLGSSAVFFDVTLVANELTRFSKIRFENGDRAALAFYGAIVLNGSNTNGGRIRINNCRFSELFRATNTINTVLGVFDNNYVTRRSTSQSAGMGSIKGSTWDGATNGDGSWAADNLFGTDNFFFIEDCDFDNLGTSAQTIVDAQAGGRYVFRNNRVGNLSVESHGLEAQRERSGRAFEIYGNTFAGNGNRQFITYFRGGVGVIYDNTISGFTTSANLSLLNNRTADLLAFPFGGADGQNPWDENDAGNPFETGTVTTGGNRTFTDSSQSWTTNEWTGYILRKTNGVAVSSVTRSGATITVTAPSHGFTTGDEVSLYGANEYTFNGMFTDITVVDANTWTDTIPSSTGAPTSATGTIYACKGNYFSEISSNTATTITVKSSIYGTNYHMIFNIGDTYEINKITHAMDQPGRKMGSLVSGTNPSLPSGWNDQTTDPWYEWNNTREGGADVDFSPASGTIVSGVHFVNDTTRPGYTAYTYPHPLRTDEAPDIVAPTLFSATVNGSTLTLTFTESIVDGAAAQFALSSGSLSAYAGSGTTRTMTVTPAAEYGDPTYTINYTPGDIEDSAGNALAAISGFEVTNETPDTGEPATRNPGRRAKAGRVLTK